MEISVFTHPGWDKILTWLYYFMGLLEFHNTFKILITSDLKQPNFWPSADVKPISNYLVHAMHWKCMFTLPTCIQGFLSYWVPRWAYWQAQQQRVNYSQKCFILLTGVDLYIVTNTREKGLHDTPTPVTNITNLFTLLRIINLIPS